MGETCRWAATMLEDCQTQYEFTAACDGMTGENVLRTAGFVERVGARGLALHEEEDGGEGEA